MKRITTLIFAFLLSLPTIGVAQENSENEPTLERAESWTELTSKAGVTVDYKYADCSSEKNGIYKENVLLRFTNENQESVSVEWNSELWYDGNCKTCDLNNEEHHHRIELSASGALTGDCSQDTPQHLKVFVRFLKSGKGLPDTELTGLRLADLQVR